MDRQRLDDAIDDIVRYTDEHPDLGEAHHFLYDLPFDPGCDQISFIVIGLNPGESKSDWISHPNGREQETSRRDFHRDGGKERSPGSKKWRKNAQFFAGSTNIVFGNLFFWSTPNTDELRRRYGTLRRSPHLDFCVSKLRVMIEEYDPIAILFPGLGEAGLVALKFGLTELQTLRDRENNHRLVIHFEDPERRPWFFTKHWSGAHGFSQIQKDRIKDYIHDQLDR